MEENNASESISGREKVGYIFKKDKVKGFIKDYGKQYFETYELDDVSKVGMRAKRFSISREGLVRLDEKIKALLRMGVQRARVNKKSTVRAIDL